MSSPVAHAAVGYFIWRTARSTFREPWYVLPFGVLMLLPDLDALPGLFLRDMHGYHNNFSHSLLAGIAAAVMAGIAAHLFQSRSPRAWMISALACYWMHLFMDYLTVGRGIKLFWPVSPGRFSSSLKIFYGVRWSEGLWSVHHLYTLLTEALFIAAAVLLWRQAERFLGRSPS